MTNIAIFAPFETYSGKTYTNTMNLTKKLVFVLAAVATAWAVRADVPASTGTAADLDASAGTLGQRYGSFSLTDQSVNHSSNDLYEVDFGLNDPLTRYLDVGAELAYANFKHIDLERHSYILNTDATAYWVFRGLKPFATVDLGYEWDNLNAPGGYLDRPNYGTWGATVGIEIPTHPASITPYMTHQDDFRHSTHSEQANDFGIDINYWIPNHTDWAIFADIGYQEALHSIYDSWYWTIGLRQKF
jgi:hypothetical protein